MDPSANSSSCHKLKSFTEGKVNDSDPIFISVTESWLKDHIKNAQINIPGYQIIRQDRTNNRERGGVLLYVQDDLPVSNVESFDDSTCGAVICSVKCINTVVASVYRPPPSHANSLSDLPSFKNLLRFLQEHIDRTTDDRSSLIITGDFNFPNLQWDQSSLTTTGKPTEAEELFSAFIDENLLCQYITQPTRGRNILDLFLTNNPNLVLHTSSTPTSLSDHNIVTIQTTYNLKARPAKVKPPIPEDSFRSLNLYKADFDEIDKHLESINWEDLQSSCSPEEFPEVFKLKVLEVCKLYSPTKSNNYKYKNFFTRERDILRRRKRKVKPQIESLSAKNPNSRKLKTLRAELYDIERKIKESIINQRAANEIKALECIKKNPRYFFSYAKQFAKQVSTVGPLLNNEGNLEHKPKAMADILQSQYSSVFSDPNNPKKESPKLNLNIEEIISNVEFTRDDVIEAINEISENSACGENDIPALILKKCKNSLSYPILLIWQTSINSGHVPAIFKKQIITPVHKKSSKAEPANYRPIALTSHVIKIFERIIRKQLVAHLERNKLICPNQHGFRKHRSCLTQLLAHIDIILENLQHGMDTDVIYLDYAKAFDKVDHEILLKKLYSYGVRGKLLMWISSYLTDREQTVVINGEHSVPAKVISGVPQGTVLGPIMFILYLNDLSSCIKHSVVSSFADDTRLKKSITKVHDTQLLQEDLNSAISWSERNNMKLHQSKFELICHSSDQSNLLTELPFYSQYKEYETADGSIISPQCSVRDLGVTISEDLSWSPHINTITNGGKKIAAWTLSVFQNRSAEIMLPLYTSFVRSRLEYNSPLWNPTKVADIMKLETVQRTFTSRISEVRHLSYWDRLRSLNLMSLQRRRERYTLIHIYKIINNLAPNDISLKFYHTSRRGICCKITPLVKPCKPKHQTMYDESFSVYGAKLWNLIPPKIKSRSTLDSFKAALTKFIMKVSDNPPVPGISSQNSLLHLLASNTAWSTGEEVDGVLEDVRRMS